MKLIMPKVFYLVLLGLYPALPSSAQYFYIPDKDTHSVRPDKKGDLQWSIAYPFNKRYNFQLAYSPIPHLSISTAYFNHQQKGRTAFSFPSITNGNTYSTAIGFYTKINVLEKHRFLLTKKLLGLRIHAKLGYNLGAIKNSFNEIYTSELKYQSIFFRSGFTLDYDILSLSFSTRFLTLDYTNGEVTGNFSGLDWFLFRLNEDVTLADPRRLKETTIRISFKRKYYELFGDYTTIRNKERRNLASAYFEKEYVSLGVLFKLNVLEKPLIAFQ